MQAFDGFQLLLLLVDELNIMLLSPLISPINFRYYY